MPLRSPQVGALHVILVGSQPDQLSSDLIQIEERLRVGSILCGNFGGAPLTEIQTRKKLAAMTVITSPPEDAEASASTARIFAGKQLQVRSVITLILRLSVFTLVVGRIEDQRTNWNDSFGVQRLFRSFV